MIDIPWVYATLCTVVFLYTFWVCYIAVMGAYRAHLGGRLVGLTKILCYPLVAVGVLLDIICQYTFAAVFFIDPPVVGEHLVTSRLQRYVKTDDGWRNKTALYICRNLLDIFDPSGNHCND